MTLQPNATGAASPMVVPMFLGSGGPTVCCYPGMKHGPGNAAVVHVYSVGRDTCACGAIRLAPGTIGLPAVFPSTFPAA